MKHLMEKLDRDHWLTVGEYEQLLLERTPALAAELRKLADRQRRCSFGNRVHLRGVLDVSSICQHDCLHCKQGSSADPHIRYRMRPREILDLCEDSFSLDIRSLVLRCGTDRFYGDEMLCDLIDKLRHSCPESSLTIAMGERSRRSYERLYNAGAEGYQLLQETASWKHYEAIHSESLSFDRRMHCLNEVRDIGFQTGCGFLVERQDAMALAKELKFIEEFQPHAVELVPVGHQEPELMEYLLSILRVVLPQAMLIAPGNRASEVLAGANVVQISLTENHESFPLCCGNPCSGPAEPMTLAALGRAMSEVGFEVAMDAPVWN